MIIREIQYGTLKNMATEKNKTKHLILSQLLFQLNFIKNDNTIRQFFSFTEITDL